MGTDDEFDRYVAYLAVPHRAHQAFWHLVTSGNAALPAVRRGLQSRSADVRNECAKILDRLMNEDSYPAVIALLDDEDARVRWNALHALAGDGEHDLSRPSKADVLPRVIAMSHHDPAWEVRGISIDVLAQWMHDDDDAVAAITAARDEDENAVVRKKAAQYCPAGIDLREASAASHRSGSKR